MPWTLPIRRARPFALLAPLALLAACSTQPPYERPALEVPEAFKEGVAGSSVWQAAQPMDSVPDAWWTLFNDPALDTLQQQAQDANQNIALSVARLRAARAAVGSSRAQLLPTLGANAGATRARSGTAADGSAVLATNASVGLSAGWELDLWGRLSGGVDAARASAQASADDLAALRLSVQATVAQTYFSLRTAEAQGRLLRETLDAYQRSWDLTRNRYRAGVASSADVAQAEAQYKSTQAQLIESETSRAQLEHALAALAGRAPAAFSLPPTAELPPPPPVPAQLPSRLLERRPDIAAAERRVAAANAQVGVARAAFFPSITLSASAGYRGSSIGNLLSAPNLVWSLGPALAASLFDGGARTAAVESARAAQDQAAATYRQTVITALQEVEDSLVAGAALEREQAVQAEAVAAAQRALEVVSNQYRAGTVAYLNVLSAQATVLSAQRSLIDVRNRRLAAVTTLLKNVAGRWSAVEQAPG
ncbi:efflux transporter outer membrane subunit [Paenacidovorax monticola]|uniref:Efflux transporter outer membrane subunit n=1 Tax=Paenacidovorax monticola TaxID=1926868 RepID=A0A7H0HFQ2_9BURK|nr:efflux transporter outer membrane subunit [Paenacidovorax monticola]QNP59368.1 efflux transporter outer membrane subunit [Paenacidovorax monticola]